MIKNALKNDYIFAIVLKIISVGLGFLYTILLSRYLGAELRGEYSIISNYASIIAIIAGMGIYQAYPYLKRHTKNEIEKKKIYKNILRNILGLFIVYIVFFTAIALLAPIETRFKIILLIIPTIYLYKQLNYVLLIERPRTMNKIDVSLSVIDIVMVILLMIFTEANALICYIFLILSKAIYAFLPIIGTKVNLVKNPPILDKNIAKYIKLGFLPMLTVVLMLINHKVDIIMLSFFNNVTLSEIGVYSLGVMLAEKIWILPDTLTSILQSKLANGKNEKEVAKISRISFGITLLGLILVTIIGKPLITLAYGDEYSNAYIVTLIILLGVLWMVFYKVIYAYNIVVGKRKLNLILLSASVIINIILNIVMINIFGVIGAGYASLISFSICGLAFLLSFSKSTKTPLFDMIVIKKTDVNYLKKIFKKGGKSEEKNSEKLLRSISLDRKNNSTRSFLILLVYRLQHRFYVKKHIGIRLFIMSIIKELLFFIIRADAQISYKAEIGDNIRLPHQGNGVVISAKAIIEDNQTIYHQVTIGINENLPKNKQRIIIKSNCYLSCGCKVISSIVGENSKIGPNAVVYKDLPNNSLYVASNILK